MDIIHIQHPITHTAVAEPCVIALGFFDGVHLGHQQLIAEAKKIALEQNLKLSVMTFFPHPKQVVNHVQEKMKYITPLQHKALKMQELGVDQLIVVKFDSVFASLPSSEFVKQYLLRFQCKHAVAGFDFHYGYKGQGNMETLKREGKGIFEVTEVKKFEITNEKVSSTLIRTLISEGNFDVIPSYLGTSYETEGTVIQEVMNDHNHSFIHVTGSKEFLSIPFGVYEIEVMVGGQTFTGICQQITTSDQNLLLIQLHDGIFALKDKQVWIRWKKKISKKNIYSSHIMDPFSNKESVISW